MTLITLPYPQRKADIIRFVKRHHYSRRCPGVWSSAYAIERNGKLVGVTVYGPAPYPSVAKAFCRRAEDIPRHAWQARMVGAGISARELDELIAFGHHDLRERGYWWIHTLTDPKASVIEGGLLRLICPGFTGEVYHRNAYRYLGWAGRPCLSGFLIDGLPVHIRQGSVTLTHSNVESHYPQANSIRPLYTDAKQRWAYILADTPRQAAERVLLMAYHPQVWEPMHQPRLLIERFPLTLQPNS
jgi:hypothetical protein